jgi:5'(3')-deoxyribonucleotidase
MQVVSMKQTTFVMDDEKLIILVQGHECLYNLQHNDYNNNLVKYNCWKEIAGEWQSSGRVVTGSRQGNGMGTAWYV